MREDVLYYVCIYEYLSLKKSMKTLTISGYIFNSVPPYVPQVLTQEWAWCFFLASREPQLIIFLSILENKRTQSHTVPFLVHSWSAYFPSFSASLKLEYPEAGKNSGLCKRSLPLGINSGECHVPAPSETCRKPKFLPSHCW